MIRANSLACAALVVAAATADLTSQEVRLEDGQVLYGETVKVSNGLRITNRQGVTTVPADRIIRVRTRQQLRAELRRLAHVHGDSAHAQLELARVARDRALEADMWRHLDACLELQDDSRALARRLDHFLHDLEPELLPARLHDADVETKVRELVRRARGDRQSKLLATERVLADLEGAGPAICAQARRAGSPSARLTAIRALARRNDEGADRFVYRSAILDSSDDVREGAMRTDVAQQNARFVVSYLAPGLVSQDNRVRVRTAEAFANLGDPSAIPELAHAGPAAIAAAAQAGGSTRAYMAVVNQQSYIRDFDVEVAQASFIADPKVDVVQSGVVLDATVHAVNTVRHQVIPVYRRALTELAGDDPGADPSRWPGWLASLRLTRPRPGPSAPQSALASRRGDVDGEHRGARQAGAASRDDDDDVPTGASGPIWAGLPSAGAIIGSPSGGAPAVGSPQSGAGINVNSIGVSQPGQPALPGRR